MESVTGPGGPGSGYRPGQAEALLRAPLPGTPGQVAAQPLGAGTLPAGVREELPLLPGFRELAARRLAGSSRDVIAELAARRQAAGLSQTQVAARMGTSQSAVARLESGTADVRVSTLERYAAAVGSQLSWQLHSRGPDSRGVHR